MKKCTKCKQVKSLDQFYLDKRAKDNKRSACSSCHKQWKLDNVDYIKQYYINNKDKYKFNSIKKRYGLNENQYHKMFNDQLGLCAICKLEASKPLHIDHCHKTGQIRGLLCVNCNVALGLLKEDKNIIKSVLTYLDK